MLAVRVIKYRTQVMCLRYNTVRVSLVGRVLVASSRVCRTGHRHRPGQRAQMHVDEQDSGTRDEGTTLSLDFDRMGVHIAHTSPLAVCLSSFYIITTVGWHPTVSTP